MISVLAWLLCQIAFVLLCQAMPRHAKQIWGKVLSDQQEIIRRRSGFFLLALSLLVLLNKLQLAGAILVWFGLLSLTAITVAIVLTMKPTVLRWF
ncbi:DUF3325 domain-containing protein [Rheinheimera faecalis]|jgi:hypothetical protein|uniref:DUF3325 domain-containing protein n=1 Tax=Rheinheimera faecalis TaxID=2901141 RepID=UPI001E2B980B|nr:DUF3325 domain-containing protein [Rheinheimera faecalis]